MIKLVREAGEEALCETEEQAKVMEDLGFKREEPKDDPEAPKKKSSKKKD